MNENRPMESFHGFDLLREIGRGAYGVVYLARKNGELVALKRVACGAVHGAEECRREKRGILTLMRLPPTEGLIRIRECGEEEDGKSFFYTMDLADDELGGAPDSATYRPKSLASVASAEIALPLPECVSIGVRLAEALVRLQRAHIVHRDIKPGNVLFVRGKAVLADPGLLADEREASSIVGTPGYAPPERTGSVQGDVYGLGLTLYRISTGRPPEEVGLPPCPEANYDHPAFWKWMTILSKATAKLPSQRYHSAKGLLRDLKALKAVVSMRDPLRLRIVRGFAWAIILFGLVFPTLLHAPLFVSWLSNDERFRYHVRLPYPYSLVRFLFIPKTSPGPLFGDVEEDVKAMVDDLEKDFKEITDDIGKFDEGSRPETENRKPSSDTPSEPSASNGKPVRKPLQPIRFVPVVEQGPVKPRARRYTQEEIDATEDPFERVAKLLEN